METTHEPTQKEMRQRIQENSEHFWHSNKDSCKRENFWARENSKLAFKYKAKSKTPTDQFLYLLKEY
jgi:hypothetical protein